MNYSYLAGLIDGDGYIAIYPQGCTKQFRVQIFISNSSKGLLRKIKSELKSGGIYKYSNKTYPDNRTYNYIISKRKDVLRALKGILPHLILKRRKALRALEELRRIGT